ncbi:ATP-dependent Clp protease proteolytic subunit [Leisingera sp. XS_AS12]|uniref:ATP-dependent Clp protease proteolytic subunit n=1 Tax=Leisingera sp. XS_AS12 TaxID=3241294 RepID=UPI003512498A
MIKHLFRLFAPAILFVSSLTNVSAADMESLPGLVEGQRLILIKGPIEEGDAQNFYRLTEGATRVSVLLDSPGGVVREGLSIGAEIAMRGFTTLVLDQGGCYSICAIIWISGARSYMSPNAQIGVHAAYRSSIEANGSAVISESGVANAEIGAYLNELGLPIEAIRYFTIAGPDEMRMITPEIAQVFDLRVSIQDGFQTTPWQDRATPNMILGKVMSYIGLSNSCADLLGLDAQAIEAEGKRHLQKGHEIFGGEIFASKLSLFVEQEKVNLERQGLPRWCLANEKSLRDQGLPTFVNGPSYDCGKAATLTERTICSSRDLWPMDRMMASLYFRFRANMDGPRASEFLNTQREWLKRRNACGANISCLAERYSSRLFDFGT